MAETEKAAVRVHEALHLELSVQTGATLPAAITAALGIARKLGCVVSFTWGKVPVTVSSEDTYQGVQRRVQRQGKPAKG